MKSSIPLIAIVGPTASGKSDLAVFLAREVCGEVVSADSRQVYRRLDIGTGKIARNEMRGVPHHLLDVADPNEIYTVARYKREANAAIAEIRSRDKMPIVCGGTGFYIQSITEDFSFPEVPPNRALRESLAKLGTREMYEILQKKDPRRAVTIDKKNPRRLERAIEIVEALGKVPPHATTFTKNIIWVGIRPEWAKLQERIRTRLMRRIDTGLIQEIENLHVAGIAWERLESLGLEYKHVAIYLQNKVSKEAMIDALYLAICAYAKRQITWFKRNKEIQWFDSPDAQDEIRAYIQKKTAELNPAAEPSL